MQPAWSSGLFQNAKRFVNKAVVAESWKQIYGRQESCIEVVIGRFQFLLELFNNQRLFCFADHIQRQSADVGCLMSRLDRSVRTDQVPVIGSFDFFG